MLLGMEDWIVTLAFYANIIAVSIGVVYGVLYFNRGDDCDEKQSPEVKERIRKQ